MSARFKRRRSSRQILTWLALMVVLTVVSWSAGLFMFTRTIPSQVEDRETVTDAIVVLTGGSGRLNEGLELLGAGLGKKMFVSGVYQGVDVESLLDLSRSAPHELRCCVEIGHTADNTAGNAVETAIWMKSQRYNSLRLVTAGYHMPRSLLEFNDTLPGKIIVPHPVFPSHVKQDRWWAWPGTAYLIVGEYNKFLFAWVRLRAIGMINIIGEVFS